MMTKDITISTDTELIIDDMIFCSVESLNKRRGDKGVLPCGTKCLMMSLIFIDRLNELNCELNSNNIINVLKICMILSYKLSEDDVYDNMFNNLFGLNKKELFSLEFEFCNALDFKLHIGNKEYSKKIVEVMKT
jgi:hypothetical protein